MLQEYGEKLPVEGLTVGDNGHAFEQGFVGNGVYAIADGVNYHGATGSFGTVIVGAVNEEGMVEGALTTLEFDGDRIEGGFLFIIEHGLYGFHVACETGNGEQGPGVGGGDVVEAAIFLVGIVEANPAGEVL